MDSGFKEIAPYNKNIFFGYYIMDTFNKIRKEYRANPYVKKARIKRNLSKFEKNMKKKNKKISKSDQQLLEEYEMSDKTPEAELMWKFEDMWGQYIIEDQHAPFLNDWWRWKMEKELIDETRYTKETNEIDKMGVRAYVVAKLMYAKSIRHKKMLNIKKAARIDNANKHLKYGGRRTRGKKRGRSKRKSRRRKRRKKRTRKRRRSRRRRR